MFYRRVGGATGACSSTQHVNNYRRMHTFGNLLPSLTEMVTTCIISGLEESQLLTSGMSSLDS